MTGVHPELIEQIECRHREEHQQRHPEHGQWQVENPTKQKAAAGLAQGCRQVVVLTLVMHRMRRPEYVALVAQTVVPVVAEVIEDKGEQPDPQAAGR